MSDATKTVSEEHDTTELESKRSVLRRQSAVFTQHPNVSDICGNPSSTDANDDISQENIGEGCANTGQENIKISMTDYIESLKKEEISWKQILKERKKEVKQLLKKKEHLDKVGQDFNLDILDKDHKEFLNNRPNYEEFYDNTHDLLETTIKAVVLNEKLNKLHGNFVAILENRIKYTKQQLIDIVQ